MSSRPAKRSGARGTVVRNLGFAVALVLAGVAIWLIVTGAQSTQRIEIGVLLGLWGLLIGAICGRRLVLPDPSAQPAAAAEDTPSTEVAVRELGELQQAAVVAARAAFEAELQEMLRRELGTAVDTAVHREVGELRDEIAALRHDLLEKVGGQLRLERIETTRIIGSDLEAMRNEVRRLQVANENGVLPGDLEYAAEPGSATVSAMRQVLDGEPATAQIPRIPADGPVPAPAVREVPEIPEPVTAEPEVIRSEPVQSDAVQSDAVQSDAVEPAPVEVTPVRPEAAAPADDPFSSLPRLTPFTDLPLEEPEAPDAAAAEPSAAGQSESTRGRHEVPADEVDPDVSESRRRHRRAAEQGDDVLARLLAREAARR